MDGKHNQHLREDIPPCL